MNDRITEFLSELSLQQLQALQSTLTQKIHADAELKQRSARLPPVPTGDISKAAEALGLDISSLLRDVKRRSVR